MSMMNKIDILDDMNNCVSPCADIARSCLSSGKAVDIDWLVDNLPGMNYVKNRALNYIFSNGLASGNEDETDRLRHWLYETHNEMGSSNYLVLREAIGLAIVYGECGVRMYNGCLYRYPKGHFGVLYEKTDGITKIQAYFVHEKGEMVEEDLDRTDWEKFREVDDILAWFEERKLILLDPSEFTNLRNDTSYMHGLSPLLQDKQRIQLLLSVYKRLNYDIEYDGPGRILLRAKSNYGVAEENEQSTTSVITNNSAAAIQERYNAAKLEAKQIAADIKGSSSDQVIVVSDGFKDDIEHLPRVTRATEFIEWIANEGVIVAQILGMSSVLVEVGKWSGNVSMEKVIDDAMVNTIVPLRELYAVQFSGMISRELKVSKVFFDKYDMKQAEDENVARVKIATIIRDLSYAVKSNDNEDVKKVITSAAEVLERSLYDDNGNIRSL